jgi:hypothetical protein
VVAGQGGTAGERFPFVIPGDDATPSVTDLSGWNGGPIGLSEFVTIRDGHFYVGSDRLRIWGVNTCFGGNFPSPEDAEKVAAHLAKLGINGVRFHHLDMQAAPAGLWRRDAVAPRTFDPVQVDRLDHFLYQLHRHGIYANLNLHVSRTLTEAEGFPRDGLPRDVQFDKYLLYFVPGMKEQLKQYCRDYLLHRNRYRGVRRVDDPGIALIEITNENAFSRTGPSLAARLPEPYRGFFKTAWNGWLQAAYDSTAELSAAWREEREPEGQLVGDGRRIGVELGTWALGGATGTGTRPRFNEPGPAPDVPALRVVIDEPAGNSWGRELQLRDLSVEAGRLYTLSFHVRAERGRPLYLDLSRQGPGNWDPVGYREVLRLGPAWQHVTRTFRPTETQNGTARLCFKFGDDTADFWLADVTFREGGVLHALPKGQSLEAANIDIPITGWTAEARADAVRFMEDTERGFIRDMMSFLKDELGVRVPVTASQITYHGAEIVADTCDYVDSHAYWHHPVFPGQPWDRIDWTIENTPMAPHPVGNPLAERAGWRLLDRPYTLSEWNIPAPHDYAASVVPYAALFAGLQDWDGVFFFQYHSRQDAWFDDGLRSFFSFNGHPAKLSLITVCAPLFRRGDLPALSSVAAGTLGKPVDPALWMTHLVGRRQQPDGAPSDAPGEGQRLTAPDGRAIWDAYDPDRATVRINTPNSRLVWGLVAGQRVVLGDVGIDVGPTERDYAVLALVSMDGEPIKASRTMLLAAVGSAENPDMTWNDERTSVGDQWGRGPAVVNGIEATLTLPGDLVAVRALDGAGHPTGEVDLQATASGTRFRIGPRYRTLWYVVIR